MQRNSPCLPSAALLTRRPVAVRSSAYLHCSAKADARHRAAAWPRRKERRALATVPRARGDAALSGWLTVYETYGSGAIRQRKVIVRERSRVLRIIVPADAGAGQDRGGCREPTRSSSARSRSASSRGRSARRSELLEDRENIDRDARRHRSRRRRRSPQFHDAGFCGLAAVAACCGLLRCLLRALWGHGSIAALGFPCSLFFRSLVQLVAHIRQHVQRVPMAFLKWLFISRRPAISASAR